MVAADWRAVFGPLLTLATVSGIFLLDRYVLIVPNPGAISFIAVVFSAYIGGMAPGLVSAAISVAFAAIAFSIPDQPFRYRPDNLARLYVVAVATPAIALMVGALQERANKALRREHAGRVAIEAQNRDLSALRASLDHVDYGIVLLDSELRARFMNHAFRWMWRVPDELADRKPAFVGLVYHGRDTRAYAVNPADLDEYVAELAALVRSGDETPIDIRLATGEVICMHCNALPDGGRMLTYVNVTDRVSHAQELEELATHDGLTGLYNRRHFLALADGEWSRFRRYGRPMSLLAVDIDLFKSVNDRYGHDVGDRVIVIVAEALSDNRSSDVVARVGGEEFALMLPETKLEEACTVADRLRQAVAEQNVSVNGVRVSVTISVGASQAGREMGDFTELMKQADVALYRAKQTGRNRVCTFDEAAAGKPQPDRASATAA